MSILKNLLILFCLVGLNAPAYASLNIVDLDLCSVANEDAGGKGGDDKKKDGEEEEPDCE